MNRIDCIIFGALGGISPTIARLAATYSTNPEGPPPELGFWIGVACFAILGAIIAMGIGSKEVKAAIFAGIAAPGIVTNVVAGHTAGQQPVEVIQQSLLEDRAVPFMFGISTAHAQLRPVVDGSAASLQRRPIAITPQITGGVPKGAVDVFANMPSDGGDVAVRVGTIYLNLGTQNLEVPTKATSLTLADQTVPISGQFAVDIAIQTAPGFGSDLIWALGGERQFNVQKIDVLPTR